MLEHISVNLQMIINGFVQAGISKALDHEDPSSGDSVTELDDVTSEQDLSESSSEDDTDSDDASLDPDANLEESENVIVIDSSSKESDLNYSLMLI